jgi:hypothetical protein
MDIDKEISSLERNGSFISSSSSPKLTLIKLACIFVTSTILTYVIKPIYTLELTYNSIEKECGYKVLKKRFFFVSLFIFFLLSLFAYYCNFF